MRIIWLLPGVAAALVACGSEPFEPPARTPQVVAEEARLAAVIEEHHPFSKGPALSECAVRLLGSEGSSSFVWMECEFADGSEVTTGVSSPVRVDGDTVRSPEDGSGYSASIRAMFPERMAEAALEDRDRLRPVRG